MKLPAIPFLTRTVATDYFLALIFESDKVSSILFKEQEKNLVVLSSTETTVDLEELSTEQIIVACDKVISRIEIDLPEGVNLEKTIFAVPQSWVDDGRITPERLKELKKISEELALTPMGFVVSIEAIIAYLQKKGGAPVNGIFIEVGDKALSVFIVRGSNIIDYKRGSIDSGVEQTVENLLASVTKLDVLPPKIFLLHNKEAEEISQKFLSHHWTKELPFMHLPQVSILEKNTENDAIVHGVAAQLNVNVVGAMASSVAVSSDVDESQDADVIDEASDEFGFEMDEDVAGKEDEDVVKDEPDSKNDNLDFTSDAKKEPVVKHHKDHKDSAEEEFEEDENAYDDHEKIGVKDKISSLFTPSAVFGMVNSVKKVRRFIVPFIALVVVVLLLISYYSFILKAKVTVFTDQRAFSESALEITLTTEGESSFEDKTLKVMTINETVEGEQSQETTGTEDTGNEAKGQVTIFNKTESPKEYSSATTIVSSNNLEFTLDNDVNIASTSSFSTSFSNAKVNVTASKFGKEYNLPSQTNFTIEDVSSSDVFARNDQAFTGGTKEQIRVISAKDVDTLETTLIERLFEKALSQAETNLSKDDALIPVYIDYELEGDEYSGDIGDQAASVKLIATINYILGAYNKEELLAFVESSEDFDVPDDFRLSDEESNISISDISQEEDNISAKLSFKAVFKPQLDEEKIPELVAGKGIDDATNRLKEVQGVSDVTIQFENAIPFLPTIIPLNKNNITLEFEVND